jgi:ubiquinol-cytochrome c reductase cytochrome c subunit
MPRRTRHLRGISSIPILVLLVFPFPELGSAQAPDPSQGQATFGTYCAACHSTGPDRILGPGLAGILDRREHPWLVTKITAPERLLAEGDTITLRLVEEYGMAMGNFGITPDQAEHILAYLRQLALAPPAGAAAALPAPADAAPPTRDQILLGQALFQGSRRFENRGVSCNACHDVSFAGTLGGGSLAVGLTDSHSRLGGAGLQALMASPPFPVMRRAYEDRPLTNEEIEAVAAFLLQADAEAGVHPTPRYGLLLLASGVLGTLLLLGLSSTAWRGRRRGSVNQEIFERQIRTG